MKPGQTFDLRDAPRRPQPPHIVAVLDQMAEHLREAATRAGVDLSNPDVAYGALFGARVHQIVAIKVFGARSFEEAEADLVPSLGIALQLLRNISESHRAKP